MNATTDLELDEVAAMDLMEYGYRHARATLASFFGRVRGASKNNPGDASPLPKIARTERPSTGFYAGRN